MDNESRNAFIVLGAVLVGLLAISLIFSGRSADAIYTGPPVHERYQIAVLPEEEAPEPEDVDVAGEQEDDVEPVEVAEEEAPAEDVAEAPEEEAPAEDVAEATEEEAPAEDVAEAPEEEAPAEDVAEAPAEEAPAEDEAPVEQVALAGDPAAGERVWRQCQACHQIGEGAQNRVGPHLTDIIDRPKAVVEGFNYSSALAARGEDGGIWSVDELRGFLAAPRDWLPGTSMAFAGVRSESDLENLIAYLASYE
jgi:cytochrome c2